MRDGAVRDFLFLADVFYMIPILLSCLAVYPQTFLDRVFFFFFSFCF